MVGLAVASCAPDGGGDDNGGSQGGGTEFTIEITNVGDQTASVTITPKDLERTYYWSATKMEYVNEEGGPNEWMDLIYEQCKGMVDGGFETWVGGDAPLLVSGVDSYDFKTLAPNTTYCVYAFGVDANGNLTSTNLTYKTFTTKESTFDTSAWSGVWNVTSPKVYVEMVAGEQYQSGVIEVPDGYTRPVLIEDIATTYDDPSMAGYAYVWGWDAVFPAITNLEEEGIPALATYVGNKLEFVNDEVMYKEEGFEVFWTALWDNDYLVGGTNYAPYKFVMGENNSATIQAGGGQLTSGEYGTVALFSLWVFYDNKDYYPYYVFTDGEEPAYHFSGETMTAVKADNSGVAPAKLSKKNGRIMHKFANANGAAFSFSSAVKMAKVRK